MRKQLPTVNDRIGFETEAEEPPRVTAEQVVLIAGYSPIEPSQTQTNENLRTLVDISTHPGILSRFVPPAHSTTRKEYVNMHPDIGIQDSGNSIDDS